MNWPKVVTLTFFVFCALLAGPGVYQGCATDPPFTSDVPYRQAVPAFLNAVTAEVGAVKDPAELETIGVWEEETRSRIQEFLDDWIAVSAQWPDSSAEEMNQEYQRVLDKWAGVILSCPGCEDVAPGLEPLVDELFFGLPRLRPYRSGRDVPLQNLYEWYGAMEAKNPWGAAAFFQLSPPVPVKQEYFLKDFYNVHTEYGYSSYTLFSRKVTIVTNGEIVYDLEVRDDEVMDQYIIAKIPTLMHALLEEARRDNLDPLLIEVLERYVNGIDEQLLLALEDGAMSQDFYNNIYGLDCSAPYGDAGFASGCIQPSWLHRKVQEPWNEPFLTNTQTSAEGLVLESRAEAARNAASERMSNNFYPPLEGNYRRVRITENTPADAVDVKMNQGTMVLGVSSFLWLGVTFIRLF